MRDPNKMAHLNSRFEIPIKSTLGDFFLQMLQWKVYLFLFIYLTNSPRGR